MPSETGPAYRIHTPRLLLRCWEPADTAELLEVIGANLDYLRPWIPLADDEPRPLAEKLKEVRKWRAEFDLDGMWAYGAWDRDGGRLVGSGAILKRDFGASAEVGGWIAQDVVARGLAREIAATLTRVAFEVLGFQRVQGTCERANEASVRLMAALGFTHEGTRRLVFDGAHEEEMMWALLADEWPASPAARLSADCEAWDVLGDRLF